MKNKEEVKKIAKEHAKKAGKELLGMIIEAVIIVIGCIIAIYFLKNILLGTINDIMEDMIGTTITEQSDQ